MTDQLASSSIPVFSRDCSSTYWLRSEADVLDFNDGSYTGPIRNSRNFWKKNRTAIGTVVDEPDLPWHLDRTHRTCAGLSTRKSFLTIHATHDLSTTHSSEKKTLKLLKMELADLGLADQESFSSDPKTRIMDLRCTRDMFKCLVPLLFSISACFVVVEEILMRLDKSHAVCSSDKPDSPDELDEPVQLEDPDESNSSVGLPSDWDDL
ncbi:MAG: hypothetical protein JSS82_00270 [Bacteroidetes bacterium]|nr:hypothetical protein [Bacteroidota bacterium]